jgi:hypothetical protein
MSPENKAKYLKTILDNDISACIRVCNNMIGTCVLKSHTEYYKKVKEILKLKK